MNGFVTGTPRTLLRLEGLLVLAGATIVYSRLEAGWWLFGILFFAPDVFMVGYLLGRKAGAVVYNFGHCYALPLAVAGIGVFWAIPQATAIGVIWAAHIGFDRALGYGLKYDDGFSSNHLGQAGQGRSAS
ncbi:DUF4260 family protein [Neorhizobium lilium]|uniref:DUF4260 family protein n=1 Tax=Neorhizobium lilium TaxID=2503024 RepID=A0A3S3RLU3_9HYPH|nr:DUF4260 domain-containing protein [Neorhizobium lilium]RWX81636.1 DUF4260 family protein [Neorhizobium lilium]